LHIRDMAEAYVKLAEHVDEVRGEAFNFGSGVAVSTRELALRASRAFDGREREPIFSGKPNPRPTVKYLDTRKAERMLGWRPSLDLDAGLTDAMAFYRQVLGSER
jgi:nucleoside-diphosphate-sugar epimerase